MGRGSGRHTNVHKTRLLAMLVVLAVLGAAGLNLGTPAGEAQEQLADVEGHWAEDEILQLAEEAIVTGYPDGTFKADRPITRAELATILTRAFELAPTVEERPS